MCQCESQLLPALFASGPRAQLCLLQSGFSGMGLICFPLIWNRDFFLKPFITQHLSLPCMKSSTPKSAEPLSVISPQLSKDFLEQKNTQSLYCSKGDDTCLSLPTILALLAVSFKMLVVLRNSILKFQVFFAYLENATQFL